MVEMDKEMLGRRLRKARKAKGLTQEKLGELAEVGDKYISRIETGKADISLSCFIRLVNTLEVSPDYFLQDCLNTDYEIGEEEKQKHISYQTCGEKKTERLLYFLDEMITIIRGEENDTNCNL